MVGNYSDGMNKIPPENRKISQAINEYVGGKIKQIQVRER